MAVLSKPLLRQRLSTANVKSIVNDLTALYLQNRTRISRAVYLTLFVALINRVRNAISEQKKAAAQRREAKRTSPGEGEATGRKKVELNREFFKSLLKLLRICIPGWKSKELRLIISHSVFLILRTMISVYVAELDGRLVSSLVRGKGKEFLTGLVWWMCVAVPATFTNSMVCSTLRRYAESGEVERKNVLTLAALIPPVQTVVTVPNTIDELHTQQISLANDLLYSLCARRSYKERRPAYHRGHRKVLELTCRTVLEPREADTRYHYLQLQPLEKCRRRRALLHVATRTDLRERNARPHTTVWEICCG